MLKFLGGTFLIIGSIIGGGILAIPIVSANFGFLTSSLFIVLAWMVMTKTGFIVLDLCLSCPEKYNSYFSIVGKFLGNKIQVLTSILFLWLLYLSLSSYISGFVSVTMSHLNISYFNISLGFVLILGSLVVISAKMIVRLNIVFVILKLTLLFIVIATSYSNHYTFPTGELNLNKTGAFSLLMIVINAFGFQFIIPSLVSYYGAQNRKSFTCMLMVSTTTVLVLYLAWLWTIYSIIPVEGEHGLQAIYQSKNQLLSFNESLLYYLHSEWASHLLSTFEIIALFGSFLCVSLGVFDFLVDAFKAKNRVLIGFLTFIPPLLLTLLSENMYVLAISAAGYIAIVLEIIIPICARRGDRRPPLQFQKQIKTLP